MAYTKKNWVNVPNPSTYEGDLNLLPRFDAENMNRIEDGIEEALSLTPNDIGAISKTIVLDSEDILSISEDGWYYTRNCTNTPISANGYMRVIRYNDEYRTVEWISNGSRIKYLNILKDGSWIGWVEMLHTGNAPSSFKTLGTGASIPENANLNSYTTVGNYVCPAMVTAATLSNCPVSTAFYMTVSYANGTNAYLRQDLVEIQKGVSYYRSYDKYMQTWGDWQSVYATNNKPKPSDIGAAPAYSYGTDDLTAGTSELETGKLYFVYE